MEPLASYSTARWEYMQIDCTVEKLNKLGAQGWELFAVGISYYYLRRKK